MKVLVCGGRYYNRNDIVFNNLDLVHRIEPITEIIEGGARGADALGRMWALARNIPFRTFNANWEIHGKSAGPIRNAQMLEQSKPWLVVAFPGGKGTANMIALAKKAGVQLRVVSE